MTRPIQPTRHGGIMASGAGLRLGPVPSKPMVEVGGRPLIEFSLREFERAGVEHVAVTARPSDRRLRNHLARVARSGRFKTFDVLDVDAEQGAGAAIHALVEQAGDVPQFLSAADVVTRPGAYYDLSCFGIHREPGELLSVIGYTVSPPDGQDKKWVYLDERGPLVRDFGAGTTADHIEFAGVRWFDTTARQVLRAKVPSYRIYEALPVGQCRPISESQMQREMLDSPVIGIWVPDAVNVNMPSDIGRAEQSIIRQTSKIFTL